jgi:hypothetical protein
MRGDTEILKIKIQFMLRQNFKNCRFVQYRE